MNCGCSGISDDGFHPGNEFRNKALIPPLSLLNSASFHQLRMEFSAGCIPNPKRQTHREVGTQSHGSACVQIARPPDNIQAAFCFQPQPFTKEKQMKKMLVISLLVLVLLVSNVGIGQAVTDGTPDGEGHPFVGLMIFDEGGAPAWRCSGTLLSPTVMLTAGHCTDGTSGGRVWFETDVQQPGLGYPTGGATSVEFCSITTHPLFHEGSFVLHDVGVVTLCKPVYRSTYGKLPKVNQLDSLKTQRGQQDVTFTAVGYGLQMSFPDAAAWKEHNVKVRMVATPKLNQINVPGFTGDYSLLLSNNANTGGTCFGDSGGPNFLGSTNIVAGVTSFGLNSTCAGTGGVFRMDRQNVLDFVNSFLK
jgi:hypothetical protein